MERQQKKRMISFCLLCALVYFTSYITRKSYNASILTIMEATGFTKESVGLAVTGSFITYGLGQVLFGFLGDKIRPRYMIFAGLAGASLCNILIPALPSVSAHLILWSFNGFFQSMIWPPLVRAMSENFTLSFYNKGSRVVLIFSSISTAVIYALASLCAAAFTWQTTFFVSALFGTAVAFLWFFVDGRYDKNPVLLPELPEQKNGDDESKSKEEATPEKKMPLLTVLLLSGAFPIMAATMCCGFLRDGIETWMSSFIGEAYGLDASGAILSVAILPLLSILSFYFASFMQKKLGGVISACVATWGIATVTALALALFYRKSLVFGIAAIAVLNSLSHAANMLMTVRTGVYFRKTGCVSTMSGLINACVYIGSSVSAYGIAGLSDILSWSSIFVMFGCVTAASGLVLLFAVRRWNRFCRTMEQEEA